MLDVVRVVGKLSAGKSSVAFSWNYKYSSGRTSDAKQVNPVESSLDLRFATRPTTSGDPIGVIQRRSEEKISVGSPMPVSRLILSELH